MKIDLSKAAKEIKYLLLAHRHIKSAPNQYWEAFANRWATKMKSFVDPDAALKKRAMPPELSGEQISNLKDWVFKLQIEERKTREDPLNKSNEKRFALTIEAVTLILIDHERFRKERKFDQIH